MSIGKNGSGNPFYPSPQTASIRCREKKPLQGIVEDDLACGGKLYEEALRACEGEKGGKKPAEGVIYRFPRKSGAKRWMYDRGSDRLIEYAPELDDDSSGVYSASGGAHAGIVGLEYFWGEYLPVASSSPRG